MEVIGRFAFNGASFGTTFTDVITNIGVGLTIPGSVKRIEEGAFNWCGMSSITFEDGVEYIGKGAFYDCRLALTSITLPSTLKTIGPFAFMWCNKLSAITIPEGVESIGSFAFAFIYQLQELHMPSTLRYFGNSVLFNNYQLSNITIKPDCQHFTMGEGNEEGIIFNKDKTRLIFFSAGQKLLGRRYQYKVPTHVKEIGGGAFSGVREELRSIVLHSTLELIDSFAFIQNPLERITIPANTKLMVGSIPSECKEIYMMGSQGADAVVTALTPIVLYPNAETRSRYYGGSIHANIYTKESLLPLYSSIAGKNDIGYEQLINPYQSWEREAMSSINTVSAEIPGTTAKQLTTLCRDFDIDLSDATLANGVKAYIATEAKKGDVTELDGTEFSGTYIIMKPVNYIPSRTGDDNNDYTGVVLVSEPGKTFSYKMGENDCFSGNQTTLSEPNLLEGAPCYMHVYPIETEGSTTYECYGLNNGRFKSYSSEGTLSQNKAYLRIPNNYTFNAKEVVFSFEDAVTTGIDTPPTASATDGPPIYDLQGRRYDNANSLKPGIYIIGNKKMMVK